MIKLAGGHKFFKIFLFYCILIFSKNIFAVQIYDYHTENFINKINSEILNVNSYKKKINFKIKAARKKVLQKRFKFFEIVYEQNNIKNRTIITVYPNI